MAKAFGGLIFGVLLSGTFGCSVIEDHSTEKVSARNNRKLSLASADAGSGDVSVTTSVESADLGLNAVTATVGVFQIKLGANAVDIGLNSGITLSTPTATGFTFALKSLTIAGLAANAFVYNAAAPIPPLVFYPPAVSQNVVVLTAQDAGAPTQTLYAKYIVDFPATLTQGQNVTMTISIASIVGGFGGAIAVQNPGAANSFVAVSGATPGYNGGAANIAGEFGSTNYVATLTCGVFGIAAPCDFGLAPADVVWVPTGAETTSLAGLRAAFANPAYRHPIGPNAMVDANHLRFVLPEPSTMTNATNFSIVIRSGSAVNATDGYLVINVTGVTACMGLVACALPGPM